MRVEAPAPLHGMHDSVLISGRNSVIICVMLGASPIAPRQCVRLDCFSFDRVEEITAHLLKPKMSYLGRTMGELRRLLPTASRHA